MGIGCERAVWWVVSSGSSVERGLRAGRGSRAWCLRGVVWVVLGLSWFPRGSCVGLTCASVAPGRGRCLVLLLACC